MVFTPSKHNTRRMLESKWCTAHACLQTSWRVPLIRTRACVTVEERAANGAGMLILLTLPFPSINLIMISVRVLWGRRPNMNSWAFSFYFSIYNRRIENLYYHIFIAKWERKFVPVHGNVFVLVELEMSYLSVRNCFS